MSPSRQSDFSSGVAVRSSPTKLALSFRRPVQLSDAVGCKAQPITSVGHRRCSFAASERARQVPSGWGTTLLFAIVGRRDVLPPAPPSRTRIRPYRDPGTCPAPALSSAPARTTVDVHVAVFAAFGVGLTAGRACSCESNDVADDVLQKPKVEFSIPGRARRRTRRWRQPVGPPATSGTAVLESSSHI